MLFTLLAGFIMGILFTRGYHYLSDTTEYFFPMDVHTSLYEAFDIKMRFDNKCAVDKLNQAKEMMIEYVSSSHSMYDNEISYNTGVHLWQATKQLMAANSKSVKARVAAHDRFNKLCREWVAFTTDGAWHSISKSDRLEMMKSAFAPDWNSLSFGYQPGGIQASYGREALIRGIEGKLASIPDLKIHVLDVTCSPAIHEGKLVGIFTTMPDMSLGTPIRNVTVHTPNGDDIQLEATGHEVAYPGLAMCLVTPNGKGGLWYQSEMVLHDDASLFAAFGPDGWIKAAPKDAEIVKDFGSTVEDCRVMNWFGRFSKTETESESLYPLSLPEIQNDVLVNLPTSTSFNAYDILMLLTSFILLAAAATLMLKTLTSEKGRNIVTNVFHCCKKVVTDENADYIRIH